MYESKVKDNDSSITPITKQDNARTMLKLPDPVIRGVTMPRPTRLMLSEAVLFFCIYMRVRRGSIRS